MRKSGYWFIIFLSGLISCTKPKPQLPSNKFVEKDSARTALLKINSKLIEKEDSLLHIVAKKKGDLKRTQSGLWYHIYPIGNAATLKDSMECRYACRVQLLTGKVVRTESNRIIIGKKQCISGLEEGLKMMQKGDSATFIIPWYLAYGMSGSTAEIPAYTSLIYKVKVAK